MGRRFDVFFDPTFGMECWEGKMCSFWWSTVTVDLTDALIVLAWFSTVDTSAWQIPLYLCVRYAVYIAFEGVHPIHAQKCYLAAQS
jgi:hypothetical protein